MWKHSKYSPFLSLQTAETGLVYFPNYSCFEIFDPKSFLLVYGNVNDYLNDFKIQYSFNEMQSLKYL